MGGKELDGIAYGFGFGIGLWFGTAVVWSVVFLSAFNAVVGSLGGNDEPTISFLARFGRESIIFGDGTQLGEVR